ncbi:MAG: cation:proton antiporter, partial [Cyanobacteria bacterium J06648_11]
MDASFSITALMVVTLVAGIGAQVLANFTNVPSIVFLLLFGALLGPDGLGIVRPQLLDVGLEVIVSLSVALILFEGGLNLKLADLSRVSKSLRNLVTVGAMVTLSGGAIAAHFLSEFPWRIAFVYAALVVVTGPTVVNPILQRVRVSESVSTLLEGEGVLIDPIGAILAVAVLNVVLAGAPDTPEL